MGKQGAGHARCPCGQMVDKSMPDFRAASPRRIQRWRPDGCRTRFGGPTRRQIGWSRSYRRPRLGTRKPVASGCRLGRSRRADHGSNRDRSLDSTACRDWHAMRRRRRAKPGECGQRMVRLRSLAASARDMSHTIVRRDPKRQVDALRAGRNCGLRGRDSSRPPHARRPSCICSRTRAGDGTLWSDPDIRCPVAGFFSPHISNAWYESDGCVKLHMSRLSPRVACGKLL